MDEWHFIAERKIREAMEEGVFEHLEGMGKPLNLDQDPLEDPSMRMANRLLKNNGLAPGWMLEARDIDAESHRLRAQPSAPDFQDRVAALNRRILSFNLKAPALSLHKRMFR